MYDVSFIIIVEEERRARGGAREVQNRQKIESRRAPD
jgi:hypothetical protein